MKKYVFHPEDIPVPLKVQKNLYKDWLKKMPNIQNESMRWNWFYQAGYMTENNVIYKRDYFKKLVERAFEYLPDNCTKKLKIITIKLIFSDKNPVGKYDTQIQNKLIRDIVNVSKAHVDNYKYKSKHNAVFQSLNRSKKIRNEVIERDGSCVKCSSTENLNAHHIVPISANGTDLKCNQVTLCFDCHMEYHSSHTNIHDWIGKDIDKITNNNDKV